MNTTLTNKPYLDTLVAQLDTNVTEYGRKYMRDEGIWETMPSDILWEAMNNTQDASVVAEALKYMWDASPNGYLFVGHLLDNYDDYPHDETWIKTVYDSVDFQGYLKRYP